jgi:hypothetical protein
MTDAVSIALIGALAGIPSTLGGIAAAWFSYKASTHSKEAADTARTTQMQSNGMKDALLSLTAKSSQAVGNLAGRAELTAENEQAVVERSEPIPSARHDEAKNK